MQEDLPIPQGVVTRTLQNTNSYPSTVPRSTAVLAPEVQNACFSFRRQTVIISNLPGLQLARDIQKILQYTKITEDKYFHEAGRQLILTQTKFDQVGLSHSVSCDLEISLCIDMLQSIIGNIEMQSWVGQEWRRTVRQIRYLSLETSEATGTSRVLMSNTYNLPLILF